MPGDNKVSSEGSMVQKQASPSKEDAEDFDSSDEEVCYE